MLISNVIIKFLGVISDRKLLETSDKTSKSSGSIGVSGKVDAVSHFLF